MACAGLRPHSLLDVGAVCRGGRDVNPAIGLSGIEGNKLYGDCGSRNRAFVADDVHVTVTGIDECGGRLAGNEGVHVALAGVIVIRDGSRGNNDEAVARVGVPAGTSSCGPDVALHIEV